MNKVIKKTASVLLAAAITAGSISTAAFAESSKLSESTVAVSYAASVSKPSYRIKGTEGQRRIKLSTSTSGATIYYTTDGSKPTANSKEYTGLITITKNTTIRAVAIKNGTSSSVMKKTVRIATVLGDITGDGNINETDYNRFRNYINGSTSYICKDNADVSGNGKINSTDLKYLRQYLDGDIDVFPAVNGSSSSSSVKKPSITVYKSFSYSGKKITMETDTDGARIYYTLNGSDPTNDSSRYSEPIIVDKDVTVKAVAYKSGKYSSVKSREVIVDTCDTPYSDMNDNERYKDLLTVRLSCDTPESRIYYTDDGTDPLKYGKLYSSPLEFTKDTTLKIYAKAKGYSYSSVKTYNYQVESTNFKLSGVVWNDTSIPSSRADGIQQYGEAGINGITVRLINTATNKAEQTTTTSTINGVQGSYVLDGAKANNNYKVEFEFNGMKYRPYGSIVSGGNQATAPQNPADITIKNGGAYTLSGNALIVSANNYNVATVSSAFSMTAVTNRVFNVESTGINLALATNVYGDLNLKFGSSTCQAASTGMTSNLTEYTKIYGNDTINYTIDIKNDSPYQKLNSALIYLYLDKNLEIQSAHLSSGMYASYTLVPNSYNLTSGFQKYAVQCPEIAAGSTLTINFSAKVRPSIVDGTVIQCYAEVGEYSYSGSCYDFDGTPGNFSGYVRETDEAASIRLYAYSDVVASQSIKWDSGNDFATPIVTGTARSFSFTVTNGTSIDDIVISGANVNLVTIQKYGSAVNGGMSCTILVTGIAPGSGNISIMLKKDASKSINMPFTIVAA